MRRPETNKCRDAATGHNYVQRLSVQVPRKSASDAHPREDVLRLVIHVEESSSQRDSREDVPSLTSPLASPSPLDVRRKISWHSDLTCQRTRQMLKQIKRQRSTSLESLPSSRPVGGGDAAAPQEAQCLIRSESWRNDSKRMRHRWQGITVTV